MLVGDEYRLQTREGSEWDREFRNRQTKLNNDDAAIQFKRDQLLYGEIDKTVRSHPRHPGRCEGAASIPDPSGTDGAGCRRQQRPDLDPRRLVVRGEGRARCRARGRH